MNYYAHHIGDFVRDTARLTDSQCMAYLRLIWIYYDTESPLPNDADALAFKIGANASDVRQILAHFFFVHDDGFLHQARCDTEIIVFRGKSEKAKKSANARWENANAMRTHSERNANEPVLNANQEPRTKNQEPRTEQLNRSVNLQKAKATDLSGKPDVAEQIISAFNQIACRNYRCTKSTRALIAARLADGFNQENLIAVILKKTVEWQDDEKMRGYLRPETLFNATKFVSYFGQIGIETGAERNARHQTDFLGEQREGVTFDD